VLFLRARTVCELNFSKIIIIGINSIVRLPRSYVKWINTLANIDPRLLRTLNLLREGKWTYGSCNAAYVDFLKPYASDLRLPASWADPTVLPKRGGAYANEIWHMLGVTSRPGVGGMPCELVHGKVGKSLGLSHSCLANAGLRGIKAFVEAIAIYIPVSSHLEHWIGARVKLSARYILFPSS
jgi:hypothetical protein